MHVETQSAGPRNKQFSTQAVYETAAQRTEQKTTEKKLSIYAYVHLMR